MLISPGFPFVPTAALPLAAMMNAIMAAYARTHTLHTLHAHTAHTHTHSSLNKTCTVEGVFYYFRQRAALCQLPLSVSLQVPSHTATPESNDSLAE